MMQSCVAEVHRHVADSEFMNEFTLIMKKRPENEVRTRMLEMIEAWGTVFQNRRDLPNFAIAYGDLRDQGIAFPSTNPPAKDPSKYRYLQPTASRSGSFAQQSQRHQPQETPDQHMWIASNPSATNPGYRGPANPPPLYGNLQYPPNMQPQQYPQASAPMGQPYNQRAAPYTAPQQPQMTPEQVREKIRKDLTVAKETVAIFSESIAHVNPAVEDVKSNDIITEFERSTRDIQTRIMRLIETVTDEELLPELLAINDDAVTALSRYDGLLKGKSPGTGNLIDVGTPTMGTSQSISQQSSLVGGNTTQTNARPAATKPAPTTIKDEFDDLLASRTSSSLSVSNPPPIKSGDDLLDLLPAVTKAAPSTQATQPSPAQPIVDPLDDFDALMMARTQPQPPASAPSHPQHAAPTVAPIPVAAPAKKPAEEVSIDDDFDLLMKRSTTTSSNPMVIGPDTAKAPSDSKKAALDKQFDDVFGL
eukprot:TRINITY_DN3156_c2_g1_i2.p1 TRINITY_DN3156_c2_g1~~TRINITY_DN3156_c2_g1_i2.p1  ORF type:complete len:476 (-),score=118.99 TRINITY_DN3156_c2_g1_i2:176-1603(-)